MKLALIFIFLALPVYLFAQNQSATCQALYQELEEDLAKANVCLQDSDCDTLELGGRLIKFGCYHFVNVLTDKDDIYEKMHTYYGQCEQMINDCAQSPMPVCVQNKCVEVKDKE
ncbi:MAG: hypothetical protein V1830_05315 [Candidatus Omnitrophota bacterium]